VTVPVLGALEFPPVSHLFVWPEFFDGTGFNKTALVLLISTVATCALFLLGGRKRALVPSGIQNVAEASFEMVETSIADEVMGHDGKKWAPYFTALFFFIFFANICSIIPVIQFPATSRFAITGLLAIVTYLCMIVVGVKVHGPKYFVNQIFPPGVPKPLYILVTPIEFVSKFLVRPFSLAVRLFANLVAGHVLLTVAALMSAALWSTKWNVVFLPGPILLGIAMTLFEVLVAVLQAYIFTILTAVYVAESYSHEH
jgi:F-type H+-transporting ATPase subunit a